MDYNETYLYHYGVIGMRWGIRKNDRERLSSAQKKTVKTAQKDAKRYLDAKMYYGDGAGTRRKLLKAELSGKMKDPLYKKTFDDSVKNGDVAKSAVKARRDRKVADTKASIGKTKRHILRTLAGTSSIATLAATAYFTNPEIRERVNSTVTRMYSQATSSIKTQNLRRWASKIQVYTG